MISIRDISKEFNGVRALDKVTLSVGRGEIFGVIGPNGAGKTTLIRVLTGQITPTAGEILMDGEAVNPMDSHYRLRVGLVPQEPALYGRLSARENLVLLARLYGRDEKDIWPWPASQNTRRDRHASIPAA